MANIARKEGLLALEEAAGNLEDAFMKKGVGLIVDGTEPELVKSILEAEIDAMAERHKENYSFFGDVAGMGPSWGMIGTLLGLVLMLQNMSDPSSIGPSMAVALITTFYGSVLANWFCYPAENKLKARSNAEYMAKSIIIEGWSPAGGDRTGTSGGNTQRAEQTRTTQSAGNKHGAQQ